MIFHHHSSGETITDIIILVQVNRFILAARKYRLSGIYLYGYLYPVLVCK